MTSRRRRTSRTGLCALPVRRQGRLVLCVVALALSSTVFRTRARDAETVLAASRVPRADVVLAVDAARFRAAPIHGSLDGLTMALPAGLSGFMKGQTRSGLSTLADAMTAADGSILRMLFSADLGDTGFQALRRGELEHFVLALHWSEPVSLSRLEQSLKGSAGAEAPFRLVDRTAYRDRPVLVLEQARAKETPAPRFWMTSLAGDRVLAIGGKAGISGTLDRLAGSAPPVPLSDGLRDALAAMPAEAAVRFVMTPDDPMRQNADAAAAKLETQNPMMGTMLRAVRDMQGLTFHLVAGDDMAFELAGRFARTEDAARVKGLVDLLLLGIVRMSLERAMGGPSALTQSLTSGVRDARLVVSFKITNADLEAFKSRAPAPQPVP